MHRVAHLSSVRGPRRPALPLFNENGTDTATDSAFRFASLFPHLPVASLTVSVLLFLSADEVLFECAPLNRSACGLVYSDTMWHRCQTLHFVRLPASDVLRALLGRCATCREIVLYTGTSTIGLSALSAAASSVHSSVKGAMRAAQQHSAHLSFLGASLTPHSHWQAAATNATAAVMDDVALLSGSAGARLSAAHHRFWCRFLTLLHALPGAPCFGTTLRRLDFRRAFPFPSLHHTNFVIALRPFQYTEPGCPEYLPSREHVATLVARAFAPLFFADGTSSSPRHTACAVTDILLDRIEMPHVFASMRHIRTCGVARAEAEIQQMDVHDTLIVGQNQNVDSAALGAIRSLAMFAPLQANAAAHDSLQTRATRISASAVSSSSYDSHTASSARSLFVLAPSPHASTAASSHLPAFPLPLHAAAASTLPASSAPARTHSSLLPLPSTVPLPAAPPAPSALALSASLRRISLGAHGYMHINDLLCLAALPALQTLDTGSRACDFGAGGPWHATDAILRAAQRAMLRARCGDRPFAALRALSATVEVAAAVLFLLAVGRRRPSFLPVCARGRECFEFAWIAHIFRIHFWT
jgi:hypothetical protein